MKRLRVPAKARASSQLDYREILPNYDGFVAEFGKEHLTRTMDEFFYALDQSAHLAAEPEFKGWQFPLDDFDWVLNEAVRLLRRASEKKAQIAKN